MSEFASAYFLRTSDPVEGDALLARAGVEGEFEELVENGWILLAADWILGQSPERLAMFNSGVLLWWVYSQDYGWSFRVFEGAATVSKYDCEIAECEPQDEMQFDDTLVDYARLAALAPFPADAEFQARLKAILQPDLSSFMDLDNPPSHQFLDLLKLPRPLSWPATAPRTEEAFPPARLQTPLMPSVVRDADIDPDLLEPEADKSPFDSALLGRWKVVREEGSGNWVPPTVVEWLITEEAIEYHFSDGTRAFFTYSVRLGKSPQQIDWTFERHSRMSRAELKEMRRSMNQDAIRMQSLGIYCFKDSMLYVRQGGYGVRPRNFELTPGSGGRLIVLGRIPDDDSHCK